MKQRQKHIIIIPGLGDNVTLMRFATRNWQTHGFTVHINPVGWYDGDDFQPKLKHILNQVDELAKTGSVDVMGCSAGGSFAMNVFQARRNVVVRAVNVCGRLRTGYPNRTFRSLPSRTASSPAFKQSVLLFEQNEKKLSLSERKRLMTIKPILFDEVVPPETVGLEGAYNTQISIPGHMTGIAMSLLLPEKIFTFLNE